MNYHEARVIASNLFATVLAELKSSRIPVADPTLYRNPFSSSGFALPPPPAMANTFIDVALPQLRQWAHTARAYMRLREAVHLTYVSPHFVTKDSDTIFVRAVHLESMTTQNDYLDHIDESYKLLSEAMTGLQSKLRSAAGNSLPPQVNVPAHAASEHANVSDIGYEPPQQVEECEIEVQVPLNSEEDVERYFKLLASLADLREEAQHEHKPIANFVKLQLVFMTATLAEGDFDQVDSMLLSVHNTVHAMKDKFSGAVQEGDFYQVVHAPKSIVVYWATKNLVGYSRVLKNVGLLGEYDDNGELDITTGKQRLKDALGRMWTIEEAVMQVGADRSQSRKVNLMIHRLE